MGVAPVLAERSACASPESHSIRRIIWVLMAPGSTALTRMPSPAASAAAVRVNPMTACLDMM
ncbi:hypothetical protein D3C84_835990 [compost metagenome]